MSGAPFTTQPVVELRDAATLAVPQSGVVITVSKATGNGTLSGTLTATTDATGRATFSNLSIAGTGSHSLTFTSGTLTPATSATFTVTVGAPSQLVITTQPSGGVSGSALGVQPVVAIRDAGGNQTGSTASVTASLASGTGTLSGTTTVAAVNGVATFTNLVITGTGPHTLTFTSGALTAATSASFTVSAGAPSQLVMVTQPNGAVSGVAFTTQPVVELRSATNSVVPQSGVPVTVSRASGSGTLSGTLTVMTDASGRATFTNLAMTGVGAHTLSFTSGSLTPATSASFTVTAGTSTQLAMVTQPSGAVSGTAFTTQPVVELRSALNLPVPQSGVIVTVAKASGNGTLSGTLTATTNASGRATFTNLSITGSGAHTLTFTSGSLTAATSASFTVAAGAPTQLAVTTQPSGAASGTAFTTQPAITIRDAGGNQTTSTANVTAAIASGSGTLSGTTTVAAVGGVATFTNLVITGSGAHTLRFTSTGLTAATSASFTVAAPPAATQLVMVTQPAGAVSGAAFTTQPAVELRNASNNVVLQSGVVVTVAKASGSGTLSGTLTATTNASGRATFTNLVITGSGAHTLTFTSGALTPATSASFPVASGGTQLTLTTEPGGAVSGRVFTTQPVVAVTDEDGNVAPSTASITVAIMNGNGMVSGTLTIPAVAGVGRFTNLAITGTGPHRLRFTASGLQSVSSSSFMVVAADAPPEANNAALSFAITALPTSSIGLISLEPQRINKVQASRSEPVVSRLQGERSTPDSPKPPANPTAPQPSPSGFKVSVKIIS